ncbi:MAG: ABC transporter permease [Rhodothermales bacterium]
MLKNYLLLGFRNVQKNKVASLINLVGLSAAVACAITLFLIVRVINVNDDFHANGERLFLVGHTVDRDAGPQRWGTAPAPLGPALVADIPQVERAVRVAHHPAMVRTDGDAFHETVSFADVGFFEVLTFPLLHGRGAALADPDAVILSAEMAMKYFGRYDVVGQTLDVRFGETTGGDGTAETLTVAGVAAPFPRNASFRFDLLVGYEKQRALGLADSGDWAAFTEATFLLLRQPDDARSVAAQLDRYVPVQNAAGEVRQATSFFLDSVRHPDWLTAWTIEARAMQEPLVWESLMLGVIAVLMLLVACFNYVTISLGTAARRLKEIGIRKTLGAERRQLITQFLTENVVLCLLALLGGILLAWTVTLPFMNARLARPIPLDLLGAPGFWVFLVGLLAFIGLVSGAYPAFYISAFQPIEVLRGKLKLAEKKGLTRTLTTVQFVLAFITICLAVFTASLDDKLLGGDWGYDPSSLLVVPTQSPEQHAWLRREASAMSQVRQVAGAAHHIGATRRRLTVQVADADREVVHFGVGPDYLATVGLGVAAGRAFGSMFGADSARSVVVNQTFAAEQGWADPVGESVRIGGSAFAVVGVVDDFLLAPLMGTAVPVVMGLADVSQHRFMVIRVETGATDPVAATLRDRWERAFPGTPFDAFAQAEVFTPQSLKGLSVLIAYLALFALLISCMGLFGIASQRAAGRIKEVGVRKALGAPAGQIVLLVNREFLVMLGLATLIATPLCYLGLRTVLFLAPVEISLGAAPFVLSNVLVFLLATMMLSMQTHRLVKVKPADVLRDQ